MRKLLWFCWALCLSSLTAMAADRLDLRGVTDGSFSPSYLSGITPIEGTELYARISDDGKRIVRYSFKTGKEVDVMFDVNNTQGEKIASFDGYILSPDGTRMLIRTKTEKIYRRSYKAVYYIYTIASRKLQPLSDGGPQQVPTWSADGRQVAFVRDNNIFLVKLLYDNAESQVTKDGRPNEIINGLPDWVNEEEFAFNSALVFNADGTMLCWVRYDESRVKTYSLQMFRGQKPELEANALYPGSYSYKYPKAGQENAIPSVWSFDIKSRQTRKLNVPLPAEGYIPRIKSTADADKIVVYTMNRHQDELGIYTVNPRSTVAQLLVKEKADRYIKDEVVEGVTIYRNAILVPSDRDGFMRLYLYDLTGRLLRTIGEGNCDITQVYGYDEQTGDVFYQAAAPTPRDRQVFVSRKNGKTELLTTQTGWNKALFSADLKYFINTWSDCRTPYVFTLRDSRGRTLATLLDNARLQKKYEEHALPSPEFFSFTTPDGVKLDGWMVKPTQFDPSKKYPVILFQYSGPGSQQVVNSWAIGSMGQGALFDRYLAQEGFIVACVDGRGTGARGAEFEKSVYLRLGQLESKDQVSAAGYFASLPYVDARRIGIWGWSFGGFNTLMSMSTGDGVFRAGVAVAPPTSFRFYDTIYTERYMRTPNENARGYDDNPISRADRLQGALLLCHGLADDNVHPQNAFEYSESLVQANKDFRQLFYTNRNHSIYGGNTRHHLLRQITRFFQHELQEK